MMSRRIAFQILNGILKYLYVIFYAPQQIVARITEKSSNNIRLMAMIYGESAPWVFFIANSAKVILLFRQCFIVRYSDAVAISKMALPFISWGHILVTYLFAFFNSLFIMLSPSLVKHRLARFTIRCLPLPTIMKFGFGFNFFANKTGLLRYYLSRHRLNDPFRFCLGPVGCFAHSTGPTILT